jgi:hypothetical protein
MAAWIKGTKFAEDEMDGDNGFTTETRSERRRTEKRACGIAANRDCLHRAKRGVVGWRDGDRKHVYTTHEVLAIPVSPPDHTAGLRPAGKQSAA